MKEIKLRSNDKLIATKMRSAEDNAQKIAMQSVIDGNISEFYFLTRYQIIRRKPKYTEYLDNLGLSEDEKNNVAKELIELLDAPCDIEIVKKMRIQEVYEWIAEQIEIYAADGEDIEESKGNLYIKKDTFQKVMEGIADCGYTVNEVLEQMQAGGFLKSAKYRKDMQKRYKENGNRAQWVFCIKKEGIFKDVNIQRDKENTEEGGED